LLALICYDDAARLKQFKRAVIFLGFHIVWASASSEMKLSQEFFLMLSLPRSLLVALLCFALVGCGGAEDAAKKARPKTVNAVGSITYNGQPLDFASILLESQTSGGTAAMCRSDADGKFSLDAFPPDRGAVPGMYRVSVKKTEPAKEQVFDPSNHDAPIAEETTGPKSLIPPEFGEFDTSGLTLEVPAEGSDSLKLELN